MARRKERPRHRKKFLNIIPVATRLARKPGMGILSQINIIEPDKAICKLTL